MTRLPFKFLVLGLTIILRIVDARVPGSKLNVSEEDLKIANMSIMESMSLARTRGLHGPIIATGWYHSGTRAGAAILSSLGVFMGSKIRRQSLDELDLRAHQGPGNVCQRLTRALWYVHKSGFGSYCVENNARYGLFQIMAETGYNDTRGMKDNVALQYMFRDCRRHFLLPFAKFLNDTVQGSIRKLGPAQNIWEGFGKSDWIAYGGKNPSSLSILQTLNDFFAIGDPDTRRLGEKNRITLTTTNDLNHSSSGCFKMVTVQSPRSLFKIVVITRDIRDLYFPTVRVSYKTLRMTGCNVPDSIVEKRMERVDGEYFETCSAELNHRAFRRALRSACCWSLIHEDFLQNFHKSMQADYFIFRMEALVKDDKAAIDIIRHLASYVTGQPPESFSEAALIQARSTAICGGYIGGNDDKKNVTKPIQSSEVMRCSDISSFYGRWRNRAENESALCASYVTRVAHEGLAILGYDVSDLGLSSNRTAGHVNTFGVEESPAGVRQPIMKGSEKSRRKESRKKKEKKSDTHEHANGEVVGR